MFDRRQERFRDWKHVCLEYRKSKIQEEEKQQRHADRGIERVPKYPEKKIHSAHNLLSHNSLSLKTTLPS